MIQTFSFSPYIVCITCFFAQCLILLGRIWKKRIESSISSINQYVFYQVRKTFWYSIIYVIGIISIDSAIFWLFNQWIYIDWRYQLPSVIIALILGLQYLIGAFFIKGYKPDILYAILLLFLTIILIHLFVPSKAEMVFLLVISFGIIFAFIIIYRLVKRILVTNYFKNNKDNLNEENINFKQLNKIFNKQLNWDYTNRFKRFFSLKFNILMWILSFIQFILAINGLSLLLWN